MMKLYPYLIKKKIKKLLAKARQFGSVELKEAKGILILTDQADAETVTNFVTEEPLLKDKTMVCAPVPVPEGVIGVDVKKETNAFWTPSDQLLKRFDSINADIIIDLTSENAYVMKYLMLTHGAPFRVGLASDKWELYDLSISLPESKNTIENLKQILFYLRSIRSK